VARVPKANDSCGHAAGDQILVRIAERLVGAVRAEDVVGRQSGDEFAVLLGQVRNEDEAIGPPEQVLRELAGRSISVRARSSSAPRSRSRSHPSPARPPTTC
jgi:diguanylate cyclase (GGDEF)-like protein